MRIDDTKNMWPHMNSARISPDALCSQSSRAGQRLLRALSARPTPAMTSVLVFIDAPRKTEAATGRGGFVDCRKKPAAER